MKFLHEIAEDEAELGFRKYLLKYLFSPTDPIAGLVVGKLLSDTDILVKVASPDAGSEYAQLRWGYDKAGGENVEDAEWYPINMPHKSAQDFLQQFDFADTSEDFPNIFGIPFKGMLSEG